MRIFWNSSCVSGPGFDRMCSGTASLPMSCSSAAVLTPWISASDSPSGLREAGRVHLHAPDVHLRRLILRVDGARQRFDRRQVQVRGLLHVPLLVLDAAHVDLVGAIGQVERREGQRRHPVAGVGDEPGGERGGAGADEVARRAPQEVVVPGADDRRARRQRDRRRDQPGVEQEVRPSPRRPAGAPARPATSPMSRRPPSRWNARPAACTVMTSDAMLNSVR